MRQFCVTRVDDVSFHALEESQSEENEFNSKCLLPHQTLLEIDMFTRAFIGAVSFLLGEDGISFVNARSFCQDPLEQNFGKQRQGGGGSCTPNTRVFGVLMAISISSNRGLSVLLVNLQQPREQPATQKLLIKIIVSAQNLSPKGGVKRAVSSVMLNN